MTFTGPLSDAAILKQQTEEQEVISLQIKMREEEIERDRLRSEERERRRLEGGDDDQSSAPAPAMPPTPEGPAAPTAAHTDWAAPGIGGGAHYEYEEGAPALDAAAIFGHHGQNRSRIELEQLEQLMLMEAIQASMRASESEETAPDDGGGGGGGDAPLAAVPGAEHGQGYDRSGADLDQGSHARHANYAPPPDYPPPDDEPPPAVAVEQLQPYGMHAADGVTPLPHPILPSFLASTCSRVIQVFRARVLTSILCKIYSASREHRSCTPVMRQAGEDDLAMAIRLSLMMDAGPAVRLAHAASASRRFSRPLNVWQWSR